MSSEIPAIHHVSIASVYLCVALIFFNDCFFCVNYCTVGGQVITNKKRRLDPLRAEKTFMRKKVV